MGMSSVSAARPMPPAAPVRAPEMQPIKQQESHKVQETPAPKAEMRPHPQYDSNQIKSKGQHVDTTA